MKTNSYFLLYANCIPVRGASRSTICDLQKGSYVFIPNVLFKILVDLETQTIGEVVKINKQITEKELFEYFDYLIDCDLGFFCSNPTNFPKINTEYFTPGQIHDCIIELSDINFDNFNHTLKSLTKLGCQTIEFRAYDSFSLEKISDMLGRLEASCIRNVELYLKHSNNIDNKLYAQFVTKFPIIEVLILHSCENGTRFNNEERLHFTQQKISSANCCGKISKEFFSINLPFYLEGLKHNTCLHKKISITQDGSIKNCPSLSKIYGNIQNYSLEKAIANPHFKDLWDINKDQINICKDCEFRRICSDCRAYVKGSLDKPINCNYNPYTTEYEEKNNLTLQSPQT